MCKASQFTPLKTGSPVNKLTDFSDLIVYICISSKIEK